MTDTLIRVKIWDREFIKNLPSEPSIRTFFQKKKNSICCCFLEYVCKTNDHINSTTKYSDKVPSTGFILNYIRMYKGLFLTINNLWNSFEFVPLITLNRGLLFWRKYNVTLNQASKSDYCQDQNILDRKRFLQIPWLKWLYGLKKENCIFWRKFSF